MKFGEKTYNISYLYIQPTTDQKYIFFNSRKFQRVKLEFDLCLQLLT